MSAAVSGECEATRSRSAAMSKTATSGTFAQCGSTSRGTARSTSTQGPTGAAGHRRGHGIGGHHVAGRAGRGHHEVGVRERVGQAVQVAVLGVRAVGQRARVLERAVQDADRADATPVQVFHGERRHLARADHDDVATGEVAKRLLGKIGAQGHERVGRRAQRGLLSHPTPGPRRRVEHAGEHRAGAPPPSARGAAPRAPARGSGSRRAPSSRARRRPRRGDRRRRAPSGRTGGRPVPRA